MALLQGRRGHARIVILTVIASELKAVREVFGADAEIGVDAVFTRPEYAESADRCYPFIVARSPDRSNTPASGGTKKLLEFYRPEVVLVVGIGGGIQRPSDDPEAPPTGPNLGDVVVGKYVHYAPYTKNSPDGRSLRYVSIDQPAGLLVSQHAETLAAFPGNCFDGMKAERPDEEQDRRPSVFISELVAIESIAGNPAGEDQIAMLERFDNADVVDMESMGVGRALHEYRTDSHYSPRWMSIRGVSDIVTAEHPPLPGPTPSGEESIGALAEEDNNQQRKQWKRYASEAAATFARALVARLLFSERPPSEADPGAPSWSFGAPGGSGHPAVVGGSVHTGSRDGDE